MSEEEELQQLADMTHDEFEAQEDAELSRSIYQDGHATPPEHIRVLIPSILEVSNPRDFPAEIIRAVAQAANECGLEGKRLEGLMFSTPPGKVEPEIVFEVRKVAAMPAGDPCNLCAVTGPRTGCALCCGTGYVGSAVTL